MYKTYCTRLIVEDIFQENLQAFIHQCHPDRKWSTSSLLIEWTENVTRFSSAEWDAVVFKHWWRSGADRLFTCPSSYQAAVVVLGLTSSSWCFDQRRATFSWRDVPSCVDFVCVSAGAFFSFILRLLFLLQLTIPLILMYLLLRRLFCYKCLL